RPDGTIEASSDGQKVGNGALRAAPISSNVNSERAGPGGQHVALDVERVEEGRHGHADDRIIARPRRGRNVLVPDLAEAGIGPADQVKRISLRRRGGGERGDGERSGGANEGNTAHGNGLLIAKMVMPSVLKIFPG